MTGAISVRCVAISVCFGAFRRDPFGGGFARSGFRGKLKLFPFNETYLTLYSILEPSDRCVSVRCVGGDFSVWDLS
jgi:hypothetical protein